MPCKSLPEISLRNIFRKVRCISACCGGKIVIQASDIDGRKVPEYGQIYYNPESPASFGGVDSIYRVIHVHRTVKSIAFKRNPSGRTRIYEYTHPQLSR
jgi:hypothetical protein